MAGVSAERHQSIGFESADRQGLKRRCTKLNFPFRPRVFRAGGLAVNSEAPRRATAVARNSLQR
jgi:hypothetical protein